MAEFVLDAITRQRVVEHVTFLLNSFHEADDNNQGGFESTSWRGQLAGFSSALEIIVGSEAASEIVATVREEIRRTLSDSLRTVRKLDVPPEQATTPSLEALKVYSLATKEVLEGDFVTALQSYERAIQLDPNFAMAYAGLGRGYRGLREPSLAAENTKKAYELRHWVSERERLSIESDYELHVTGNLEKLRHTYEFMARAYPPDERAFGNLGYIYQVLGNPAKALIENCRALEQNPTSAERHATVIGCYLLLNRFGDAQTLAEEAESKGLDSPGLHFGSYLLAFLNCDAAGMAKQVEWSMGKPGMEEALLSSEGETNAVLGRLKTARDFSSRAINLAERMEEKELTAIYQADAALREALFGNSAEAQQQAASALRSSNGRDVEYAAALALAFAGDAAQAEELGDDLDKRFPEATVVQFNYLPTLQAQVALSRNDASKAIEFLQAAAPYELGDVGNTALYPVFVRGNAFLTAHRGKEAASAFQKIIDHRGIVLNLPIGPLAYLGLARAYAIQGDIAKAKAAYQDFLTVWKDADPDIPILIAAKSEHAKLQ
jgi:eukaryotic-like serine/threonine-protein kinase